MGGRERVALPPVQAVPLVQVSGRGFGPVVGASCAVAGLSGCDFIRWPEEPILPFARRP